MVEIRISKIGFERAPFLFKQLQVSINFLYILDVSYFYIVWILYWIGHEWIESKQVDGQQIQTKTYSI